MNSIEYLDPLKYLRMRNEKDKFSLEI